MGHKGSGEGGRLEVVDLGNDGKCGEVAHCTEDVFGAIAGNGRAWLPDVNMNDGEQRGDGPGTD